MSQTPQWPGAEEGRALHAALFGADPTAPAAFANALYPPLCAYLTRAYRDVAEDVLVSIASDLILRVVQEPGCYKPEKLSVDKYFRMAAKRKLSTATERERRRRRREIALDFVAEPPAARNEYLREDDAPSWSDPQLAAEIAAFAGYERIAFELLRNGVRDTGAFATALDLDPKEPETARAVKRIKDTIKARLRRAVGGRS